MKKMKKIPKVGDKVKILTEEPIIKISPWNNAIGEIVSVMSGLIDPFTLTEAEPLYFIKINTVDVPRPARRDSFEIIEEKMLTNESN